MQWILRLRIYVIVFIAVILIVTAIIFSVLRAVLPFATGYKYEIQQEISQQIGLPVEIESIDAAINWFSPRLRLIGVSVYDKKGKVPLFNFQEAFVELDVIGSILHRDLIADDVGLIGAELSIEKLSEKEWLIQGIRFTSEGSDELPEKFLYMLLNSDYLLHNCDIYYQDHTGEQLNLSLIDVNMDVRNSFNNHDIRFSMNLPEAYGKNIAVVASLNGNLDSLAGDLYIEASQIKVKQWNQKFKLLEAYDIDAVVDLSLWGTLKENLFQTLLTQFSSADLSIENYQTKKVWKTDYLSTELRLVRNEGDWNVTVKDFSFGEKIQAKWGRPVNILASEDAENYYLSADFLRLDDVREIVSVLLDEEQLNRLKKADELSLSADVYNLNVVSHKHTEADGFFDKLAFDVTVVDLALHDMTNGIDVFGVDADIRYDKSTATIDVKTEQARIGLARLFAEVISLDLVEGQVEINRINDSWQLNSEKLQIKNKDIDTFSRFDIQVSADTNITIDAQTDFYQANAKQLRQYLPVGIMSPGLVDWLNMAVISGYVPEGKFILRGNARDFPYAEKQGVFQVLFDAQDVDLLFLQKWPMLKHSSATVKFNNTSMLVSKAKAVTEAVALYDGYAEINNLFLPHLTVTFDAEAKNSAAISYIRKSPLDAKLGNALSLFKFDGASELGLKLEVSLDSSDVNVDLDGHLTFINTSMELPTLGYKVNKVNGVLDFTADSLFADAMTGVIDNNKVAINISTQQGESGRENIFRLDGKLDIDYLLNKYKWVPDEWLSGKSLWSIDVHVPANPRDYLLSIDVGTMLQGVSARVSDSIVKPADMSLGLQVSIDVLKNNALRIDAKITDPQTKTNVAAKNDMVRIVAARNAKDRWGFDIKSAYLEGTGSFTEGFANNTSIDLELKYIDLAALFVTEKQEKSQPLKPVQFPPLHWKAERVSWGDLVFTEVLLNTEQDKHGMLIKSMSLHTPSMKLEASGSWSTTWRDTHETVLRGKMTSDNVGDMLTGLGFQRSIDHAKYKADFDARWSAEPYAWSWSNMKGKAAFEMEKGAILEVDPGAGGRLLGLLNIFKLTNRLALNFDDVTRKGFAFDIIRGDFEFVDGDGSLKNFDISAPAADINMFGSVGLIKHDFGLLMRVKPHTDSLTFAGGALLGGVAVGAGLALIQKVFDVSIIGDDVYSVTGSWDDPSIEKIIDKAPGRKDEDEF